MSLRQNILNEPVSRLPLRDLIAVEPTTTVRRAITMMRDKKLGCVIVVDGAGKPVGKFSERQLTRLLLNDPDGLERPVGECMAQDWRCVTLTDPIARVIELMKEADLRFVCVVDQNGRAVALTGQRGVMEYIAEHFPRQVLASRVSNRPYLEQREGA